MKFEEKLIQLRKARGLSQEDLADKLGVSRQAISRWEQGSTTPDMLNLKQLSELYGVSADYLIHDEYESDEDIPKVKETTQEFHTKENTRSKVFLCLGFLWLFIGFLNIISGSLSGNDSTIWLSILNFVNAAIFFCAAIFKANRNGNK